MRLLSPMLIFLAACAYPHLLACALPATSPATRPADVRAQLDPLVNQLSSDDWRIRQKAEEQIVELGEDAIPGLQNLLKSATDLEVRARLEAAIRQIDAWGDTTEGYQARIHIQRRSWPAGEMPFFTAELRNTDQRQLMSLVVGQQNYQLCVDGVWYVWPPGLHGGMIQQIPHGQSFDAGRIIVSPIWRRATEQLLLPGLRDFIVDDDTSDYLHLAPGRHSIRIGFPLLPGPIVAGAGCRVISNAVMIQVQPPPDGKPANWPPDAASARMIVRALMNPRFIFHVVDRTQLSANTKDLLAASARLAEDARTLSTGTPLEQPTAEFARAIKTLENYQAMTEPQWQAAKQDALSAYTRVLAVLSGTPLPTTRPTSRPASN